MTETNKPELLPCPFCGEELVELFDHHGSWYGHKDSWGGNCECSVSQIHDEKDRKRWNTRAQLPSVLQGDRQKALEWVDCPVCGASDMRKSQDDDQFLINCVNGACASNGGDNADALQSQPDMRLVQALRAMENAFGITKDDEAEGLFHYNQIEASKMAKEALAPYAPDDKAKP